MVGLLDSAYWSSWYLTTIIMYLPGIVVSVAVLTNSAPMQDSHYDIVFFFYFVYILSLIPVAFIVSVFFNKVKQRKVR
jgi:uncharacterized paraquat-inducible protein A